MRNYKQPIIASLLALSLVLTPAVSFAKDNGNNNGKHKGENQGNQGKAVATVNIAKSTKSSSNSRGNSDSDNENNENENDQNDQGHFVPISGVQGRVAQNLTPNISGITAPTVLKTGEVGTWSVRASDPQNGSLSYDVDWGDNAPQPLARLAATLFVQTGTFTHAYMNPGTYTIKFTVTNSAGLSTVSTVTVHIVGQQVQQAPVITNFTATSTKPHQAILTWDTDVRATSLVWFGTATPVDTSAHPNISRPGRIVKHKVVLNNLDAGTTYFVVVGSKDSAGTSMSSEMSFITPSVVNNNAPTITSLTGSSSVAVGDTETVTVNASDPKNGPLTYTADWGDNASGLRMFALARQPIFVQTSTFSHVYSVAGTYTATFTVENSAGLKASSSMTITVTPSTSTADVTPPVISNISANASVSTSTVSWTTDELANSKVFYSTNTPVDVNASTTAFVSDDAFVTNHSLELSDLTPTTLYHFVVVSADNSGNAATSGESTFTTIAEATTTPDTTGPTISSVNVALGSSTSTISWLTDEQSTSKIFYSTNTPVDVNSSTTPFVVSNSLVTNHSLDLSNLTPSTLYHFVLQSIDASNNIGQTFESSFTTNSGM